MGEGRTWFWKGCRMGKTDVGELNFLTDIDTSNMSQCLKFLANQLTIHRLKRLSPNLPFSNMHLQTLPAATITQSLF